MRTTIILALLILPIPTILAQNSVDSKNSQAYQLLKKAIEKYETAPNYTATFASKVAGAAMVRRVYIKTNASGERLERVEYTHQRNPESSIQTITLSNEQGHWVLNVHKKIAFNLPFASEDEELWDSLNSDNAASPFNEENAFNIGNIFHNGQPMKKITVIVAENIYRVTLERNRAKIEKEYEREAPIYEKLMRKLTGEKEKLTKAKPEERTVKQYEYVIDPESYLIWAERRYLRNGREIYNVTYSSIQYGIPMADNIFEVPPSYKIRKLGSNFEVAFFDM
jgi:hypothetical protein